MLKCPKISVITPSFNQSPFLAEAIRSVHTQDYPSLEHIVIDGGSSDDSVEVIRRNEGQIAFWVSEPDHGQSHAINKGFRRATGDILCWLNSDDLFEPGALKTVARLLGDRKEPTWLIGASKVIDVHGRTMQVRVPTSVSFSTFLRWTVDWFPQQSTFWNRAMWERAGPVSEKLTYAMDLALWRNMLAVAPPTIVTDVLAAYRIHDDAKCINAPGEARREQGELLRGWLSEEWEDLFSSRASCDAVISKIEGFIDDYVNISGELALCRSQLARVKRHPVIGRVIRAWRTIINRRFDI